MNLTSILGFLTAYWVIWSGVLGPSPNRAMFLDSHAIVLVVGGTLAAAMIAFPGKRLLGLFSLLINGVIFKSSQKPKRIVEDMLTAATVAQQNPRGLVMRKGPHPFLTEAYQLVGEGFLDEHQLEEVLRIRSEQFKKNYIGDAKTLNALAKFPPAFGLLGASAGMISMMMSLGKGGTDNIGPAMAVALVATFWGIAVANLLLLPLADHATRLAQDDQSVRKMIIEGVMMLKRGEAPIPMVEKLNSFLDLRARIPAADLQQLKQRVYEEERSNSQIRRKAG